MRLIALGFGIILSEIIKGGNLICSKRLDNKSFQNYKENNRELIYQINSF